MPEPKITITDIVRAAESGEWLPCTDNLPERPTDEEFKTLSKAARKVYRQFLSDTASSRNVTAYTRVAAVMDQIAFDRLEGTYIFAVANGSLSKAALIPTKRKQAHQG